jgi:hypothetical protein
MMTGHSRRAWLAAPRRCSSSRRWTPSGRIHPSASSRRGSSTRSTSRRRLPLWRACGHRRGGGAVPDWARRLCQARQRYGTVASKSPHGIDWANTFSLRYDSVLHRLDRSAVSMSWPEWPVLQPFFKLSRAARRPRSRQRSRSGSTPRPWAAARRCGRATPRARARPNSSHRSRGPSRCWR